MTSPPAPRVRTWGQGPVRVLAMHGWLSSSDGWDALLPHLDPARTTWALLDAPGYGLAADVPGRDLDLWVEHALAALDGLGWADAALVGHSMGGLAVQAVLAAAPHRVSRLIGVAAIPASGAGLGGERLELFDRAAADPGACQQVIAASTGHQHDPAWVAELGRRAFAACDAATRAAYLAAWSTSDLHLGLVSTTGDPLPLTSLPVDVVVGAHDPSLTAERMAQTWARWYPRCRTWTLDGSGHYPADEQPAELATLLDGLLDGLLAEDGR